MPDPDPPAAGTRDALERMLADLIAAAAARVRAPAPPAPAHPPPAPADGRTLGVAVADYLAHCDRRVAAGKMGAKCRADYARPLGRLAADLGARPLAGLSAEDLEAWAARGDWSPSTRNTYLGVVQTMLRWAKVALPVARPPKESRGESCVLTDGQFLQVLVEAGRGRYPGDLVPLLRVLRETGARPQEVARLKAADVNWAHAAARLKEHKTKGKTGRDRILHFNAAAMAVLSAQRDRYKDGLLFRTRTGRAYTAAAIARRMKDVSGRVGYRVIAYGLRHSFATRALAAGVPDAVVAELLGHRGTAMLQLHYAHLGSQSRALKDAAERVGRSESG